MTVYTDGFLSTV